MVTIRPVELRDAAGLARLTRALAEEGAFLAMTPAEAWDLAATCERIALLDLRRECWLAAVAEEPGRPPRVVGQATAWRQSGSRSEHVVTVGVGLDPAWRGRGLGRLLLEKIEEWAQAAGVRKLQLRVLSGNTGARRLYESLGYEVEGVLVRQYRIGDGYQDEVIMYKWLPR